MSFPRPAPQRILGRSHFITLAAFVMAIADIIWYQPSILEKIPSIPQWQCDSDQTGTRIQEFTTIHQCGMLVSRFWWQRDLKVVEVIPVDVYMSWSIQKCAFCLKSLEDFWQFSETSKVYSTTSHQSKQCLCWTCFQRFKCRSHLFIFTGWLNHPKNFTKFSRLKTSDVQVARDFAGQIQGASKQQTWGGWWAVYLWFSRIHRIHGNGICTYRIFMVNEGKDTVHGSYG